MTWEAKGLHLPAPSWLLVSQISDSTAGLNHPFSQAAAACLGNAQLQQVRGDRAECLAWWGFPDYHSLVVRALAPEAALELPVTQCSDWLHQRDSTTGVKCLLLGSGLILHIQFNLLVYVFKHEVYFTASEMTLISRAITEFPEAIEVITPRHLQ